MRTKKKIPGILPVKKWLSKQEACAYMDMSINTFQAIAIQNRLSIAVIGSKKYYRLSEMEKLIEENILIQQ